MPCIVSLPANHQHSICPCCLQAANILLDQAGQVMLADFGLATAAACSSRYAASSNLAHLATSPPASQQQPGGWEGSPYWMAPELAAGAAMGRLAGTVATPASDIWALGITVLELATGQVPHGCLACPQQVLTAIVQQPAPRLQSTGDSKPSKVWRGR